MRSGRWIGAMVIGLWSLAICAEAKTLRWSSQGDILTADPHAQGDSFTLGYLRSVFEHLVGRDRHQQFVSSLATSWEQTSPKVWRFHLRRGVTFHDGAPFTARDVVFSILRAQSPTSTWRAYSRGIGKPVRIDDFTVEFHTEQPNPTILDQLNYVLIMNEAWAKKHNAEQPTDPTRNQDAYASYHANGTGPFRLMSWQPDVKSVLAKNAQWWGLADKRFTGNVTQVEYMPMQSAAARVAALTSGGVDFVLDVPIQDIPRLKSSTALKVLEGPEGRVIFLGMDQVGEQLKYSDVKGPNPFKQLKVRQAIYYAIDIEAIRTTVMRGYAEPTGTLITPVMTGYTKELDARLPYDPAKSKALLTEAGYANGFSLTLDCPNNRYVNDERICLAVAAMLGKVGLKVSVNAIPKTQFFQKMDRIDTSFYLLGQGTESSDPMQFMSGILHSADKSGWGSNNYGRISDATMDRTIERVATEMDIIKRAKLVGEVLTMVREKNYYVPLHRQVIPWVMRKNVTAYHRPSNHLDITSVVIE